MQAKIRTGTGCVTTTPLIFGLIEIASSIATIVTTINACCGVVAICRCYVKSTQSNLHAMSHEKSTISFAAANRHACSSLTAMCSEKPWQTTSSVSSNTKRHYVIIGTYNTDMIYYRSLTVLIAIITIRNPQDSSMIKAQFFPGSGIPGSLAA